MDVLVNGPYCRVEATSAKVLLQVVAPAGSKQAPAEKPDGPGVTWNRFGKGSAIYCALPLFGAYEQDGTDVLRRLAAWMLHLVHPAESRVIVLEKAPLHVEMTYNARGTDRFVHLLNFGAGRRISGPQRTPDVSPVSGILVRLRCAARPKRVLLVPEEKPIACEWRDGWATFPAETLPLHGAYRIELSKI
jgi:hypothetical protein